MVEVPTEHVLQEIVTKTGNKYFSAKIDSGELKPARKPYNGLTLPMK